jgi:hypothetical protein
VTEVEFMDSWRLANAAMQQITTFPKRGSSKKRDLARPTGTPMQIQVWLIDKVGPVRAQPAQE